LRKKLFALVAVGVFLVLSAGAAAIRIRAGDITVRADGHFRPTALPLRENAPITLEGGGRIETVSGNLPPILKTIEIEFDRHANVETEGLPVCRRGLLEATTVAVARAKCPGAIVGVGRGSAIIQFEEQAPIKVSSPLTIFNGPERDGNPTVLAHAYLRVPVPTTYIVPVEIEQITKGIYGYRTTGRIPEIAGGAGVPVSGWLKVGKKWIDDGRPRSFFSARCEIGRLQARLHFVFDDETDFSGTILRPCTVRR